MTAVLLVAAVLVVSAIAVTLCARTAGQALAAAYPIAFAVALIWIGAHP